MSRKKFELLIFKYLSAGQVLGSSEHRTGFITPRQGSMKTKLVGPLPAASLSPSPWLSWPSPSPLSCWSASCWPSSSSFSAKKNPSNQITQRSEPVTTYSYQYFRTDTTQQCEFSRYLILRSLLVHIYHIWENFPRSACTDGSVQHITGYKTICRETLKSVRDRAPKIYRLYRIMTSQRNIQVGNKQVMQ